MSKLIITGRIFFALSIAGLALTHFIFGEFTTGRAPVWPEWLPGGTIWAYSSGIIVLITAILMLFGKKARFAAIYTGLIVLIWALIRQLPVITADSLFAPSWTSAGKALILASGMFLVATRFPNSLSTGTTFSRFYSLQGEFIRAATLCLGIFFVVTGVQHFIYTEFVASLIPHWFPGDTEFWTYFGGVALLAGGLGLFIPQTAKWAALFSGLMVFSWFWIIHIPRTFATISDGIAVFEALAVSGIAFMIAGLWNARRNGTGKN